LGLLALRVGLLEVLQVLLLPEVPQVLPRLLVPLGALLEPLPHPLGRLVLQVLPQALVRGL
jgi:hypothetical protein